MKRFAILTAGGDTPALNATIHGAAVRANQRNIELIGLMRGFDSLFHARVPHVLLNPLFGLIPELDPTHGEAQLAAERLREEAMPPASESGVLSRVKGWLDK